jgi:hypothetical protein
MNNSRRGNSRRSLGRLGLGLGIGLLAAVPVSAMVGPGSDAGPAGAGSTPAPGAIAPSALDRYPGFGRDYENAARDMVVAYAEAVEREQSVERCMADASFSYRADVAFPPDIVVRISAGLGLLDTESSGAILASLASGGTNSAEAPDDPRRFNREYVGVLNQSQQNTYYVTLYGETAADMDESRRVGDAPAGRGDNFATGGCVGQAAATTSSIWDSKRRLQEELDTTLDALFQQDPMQTVIADFGTCVTESTPLAGPLSGPGDVEAAIIEGRVTQNVGFAALESCMPIWSSGRQAAEATARDQVAGDNAVELETSATYYDDYVNRLTVNEAFRSYLLGHVRWIAASAGISLDR